jgi:hypothetical protein
VRRRPGLDRSQREFYVIAEGEVTERDYLAFLYREFGEQGRFVIHPITERNGLRPVEVVQRAIDQLGELARLPGGDRDIAEGRVQVWALSTETSTRASRGLSPRQPARMSTWRSPIRRSTSGSCCTSRT